MGMLGLASCSLLLPEKNIITYNGYFALPLKVMKGATEFFSKMGHAQLDQDCKQLHNLHKNRTSRFCVQARTTHAANHPWPASQDLTTGLYGPCQIMKMKNTTWHWGEHICWWHDSLISSHDCNWHLPSCYYSRTSVMWTPKGRGKKCPQ